MSLSLMMRHHALLAAAAKKGGGSGEIVYLTNFENYDSATGIDTPIIGNPLSWKTFNYKMSGIVESYESEFVGTSKRFVVNSMGDEKSGAFIPNLDGMDEFSIDFLVSSILNGYWSHIFVNKAGTGNVHAFSINDWTSRKYSGWSASEGLPGQWDIDGYTPLDTGWSDKSLYSGQKNVSVKIRLFGKAINNTREHHFGLVVSKSKKLYKLFVDGVIVHTELMDIFDNLRIAMAAKESRFKISQLCIRSSDVSSGDTEGATFPVPTKPYA